jgi:predicted ATPase
LGESTTPADPFLVIPRYASVGRRSNNLPTSLTELIGRENELAKVTSLLTEQTRLLTLTGPGGAGKTRLAIELANRLISSFPNGVFFVPLESIQEPDLVPVVIAEIIGVPEALRTHLIDCIRDFLKEKKTLLLLDNFEHVVASAPVVTELLATCPNIRVLVTSRVPLRVSGEYEFSVPPLALPDPTLIPHLDELSQYSAIQLFMQHALAVKADFSLTKENASIVVEICHELDGLPLAIELAAARVRLLPPKVILAHLGKKLTFLTGGPRDLPVRQRTLRDTIAWSHDLLSEEEAKLFRRISIFAGGCSMEATEAVCNAEGTIDTLNGVESLLAKSLLRMVELNGELRVVMLNTIREFALERLDASREAAQVQRSHADFFVELAVHAESAFFGPQEASQLNLLERELGNLRATLGYLRDHNEAEKALRMSGALSRFWLMRGYLSEGRMWLGTALALPTGLTRTRTRAHALLGAGDLAGTQGDLNAGESLLEESLSIAGELADQKGIADSLGILGDIAKFRGDLVKARSLYEESLKIAREVQDKTDMRYALQQLGGLASVQGDYATARASFEEGLAIAREMSDNRAIAVALEYLGGIAFFNGEYALARTLCEEALKRLRELGDRLLIASLVADLGEVAYREGDLITAQSLCEQSMSTLREINDRYFLPGVFVVLGRVAYQRGNYEQAKAFYHEGLVLRSEGQLKFGIADCLERLAEVAVAQNLPERAARFFGAAEESRVRTGYRLPPIDQETNESGVAAARNKLGQERYDSLKAEGRGMTIEQAITYALEKQPQNK